MSHLKSVLSGEQLLRELGTLLVPLNALVLKRNNLLLEVSNGMSLVLSRVRISLIAVESINTTESIL
jgi:hypothetical protein